MSGAEAADAAVSRPAAGAIPWWSLLTDPAFLRDPHPELRRIRALGPVHLDPASGVYFVLGHEEFRLMARAPELGRDTRLWTHGWSRPESQQRDPSATSCSANSSARWSTPIRRTTGACAPSTRSRCGPPPSCSSSP